MKFQIGRLAATRKLVEDKDADTAVERALQKAFRRYQSCDWGDLCDEDKRMNDDAVKHNSDMVFDPDADFYRLLAKYHLPTGDIYIITDVGDAEGNIYTTMMYVYEY